MTAIKVVSLRYEVIGNAMRHARMTNITLTWLTPVPGRLHLFWMCGRCYHLLFSQW